MKQSEKVTSRYSYDVMIFETLNLRGMQRMWGRKINDLAFADFLKKLQWVAKKRGKRVYQIDRWEATSKTCYACGNKKEKLGLHERIFVCEECGHTLDRDHNAALNIKKVGTSTFSLEAVRRDHDQLVAAALFEARIPLF